MYWKGTVSIDGRVVEKERFDSYEEGLEWLGEQILDFGRTRNDVEYTLTRTENTY
jgi:hypothetical protein